LRRPQFAIQNILMSISAVVLATACAPNSAQLKSAMESDPEILYAAMRKDPAKFVEVVNEISEMARAQRETKGLDEGFSDRRKPALPETRAFDGDKAAQVTIVEYSDFQCGYCAQGHQIVNQLREEYGNRVRVLLKHLPLERHPQARKMAEFFEAIAQKDAAKAKRFKSILFEQQAGFLPSDAERQSKSVEEAMGKYNRRVESELRKVVRSLGLQYEEIKTLAESEAIDKIIEADRAEARSFGFTGTPAYLINGVPVRGALPIASFKYVIDRELKARK
jgi:protein-disulfide isomerase